MLLLTYLPQHTKVSICNSRVSTKHCLSNNYNTKVSVANFSAPNKLSYSKSTSTQQYQSLSGEKTHYHNKLKVENMKRSCMQFQNTSFFSRQTLDTQILEQVGRHQTYRYVHVVCTISHYPCASAITILLIGLSCFLHQQFKSTTHIMKKIREIRITKP